MTSRLMVLFACFALTLGCDRSPLATSTDPTGPSAVNAASTESGSSAGVLAVRGRQDVLVNMQDACDPTTFNAAIGPGTCTRAGGVHFDTFIAELTRLGFAGPWHFSPPTANVQVGQSFVAVNKGGEVHTFTEVENFGGGVVPLLNTLAHVPVVAPECLALDGADFVAPGGSYREAIDHAGTVKVQCCIHPWMRLEARVK